MDFSTLTFDTTQKLIIIESLTPRKTVDAVEELIKQKLIDPMGFQNAYFTYKAGEGPLIKFDRYISFAPFHYLTIKTINLKNTEKEVGDFTDVECAIKILKMLNLYPFESIEEILKDPNNYVKKNGGKYEILVDKSGLFRWDNPYGATQYIFN